MFSRSLFFLACGYELVICALELLNCIQIHNLRSNICVNYCSSRNWSYRLLCCVVVLSVTEEHPDCGRFTAVFRCCDARKCHSANVHCGSRLICGHNRHVFSSLFTKTAAHYSQHLDCAWTALQMHFARTREHSAVQLWHFYKITNQQM